MAETRVTKKKHEEPPNPRLHIGADDGKQERKGTDREKRITSSKESELKKLGSNEERGSALGQAKRSRGKTQRKMKKRDTAHRTMPHGSRNQVF